MYKEVARLSSGSCCVECGADRRRPPSSLGCYNFEVLSRFSIDYIIHKCVAGEITSAGRDRHGRGEPVCCRSASTTLKEHLKSLVMPTAENENNALDPKNSQNIEGETPLYAAAENGHS
ncbi:unnamed protein product, partial [Brassica oleracea]|uniref:(rape) hypothetical protein n=1 Tax=Brassica napus TaxID=3708 RepID=A0A816ISB6_BRANA|nr:unnamed protein product [Brassica napus]